MKKQFLWVVPFGIWLALLFPADAASSEEDAVPRQELLPLAVRVVDPEGQPVAGAKIIPWALRSSQGHGSWKKDGQGESEPTEVTTDADGSAEIRYPRYSYADELVRVLDVTLSIDHPDFAYISHENIQVPREASEPHTVTLSRGAAVEVMPVEGGQPANLDGVYLLWSDSRSWTPGVSPAKTEASGLRIPTMAAEPGEVLAVRLEGERATHFSPVLSLDLKAGETVRVTAELQPAARIAGKLSDNVPRPVKNGRVSARTLPRDAKSDHVNWISWAPIAVDGTFEIEAWPATEDVQIIALCDGFIAESGAVPAGANPPANDAFSRPQVFAPTAYAQPIELKMTALVKCDVEAVDQQGKPLEGITIMSWPNVGWWKVGSQIYGTPLARGERLLRVRKFEAAAERDMPIPFRVTTNAAGSATLHLPAGREELAVESDDYELPVNVGRRDQRIVLVAGETAQARLVLQPKGTEHLGDWDKLAGVLFGCRGEECRRLLEDQGFRKKMSKVSELLGSTSDPHDPEMLKQAYAEIAQGFDELEDQEEADRWRNKSREQAARLHVPAAKDATPK